MSITRFVFISRNQKDLTTDYRSIANVIGAMRPIASELGLSA
jgi:hypothetical protein